MSKLTNKQKELKKEWLWLWKYGCRKIIFEKRGILFLHQVVRPMGIDANGDNVYSDGFGCQYQALNLLPIQELITDANMIEESRLRKPASINPKKTLIDLVNEEKGFYTYLK